jgi:CRP-like cAMP-binding protein
LIRLGRAEFFRLLDSREFRNSFLAALMGRLRYLTEHILRISAYDVETRFFLFLSEQFGKKQEYALPTSKKNVAAAIGATPETMSRLVLKMRKRGMTWKGKTIKLKPGFWEKFTAPL